MSNPTYILCPGQGAQAVGMGRNVHDASAAARDTFDGAGKILGFDLGALCFNGPEERLNQTDISQPAIYVTGVASFRAAVESGIIDPDTITALAGLSLGEYTALHLAGVFDFEQGLMLVAARGRYMQAAAVATPSGMVAILGADKPAVEQLCADAAGGEVMVAANFNAPGQIVVSGTLTACQRLLQLAESRGLKATALKVAGAFHSPLMQSAAGHMAAELANVPFQAPSLPVYSNVTASPHEDVESIKRLLIEQIVRPVLWEDTMVKLLGPGNCRAIELAPGRTLAGLAKRVNRRLPIESLGEGAALSEPRP